MAFGVPGTEFLDDFSMQGTVSGIGQFLIILFLIAAVGGIFYFIYYKKKTKKDYNKKIFWFEEVNGIPIPVGDNVATELTVPGSNIKVFYIKETDMYLPRPVKRMGKDAYWFMIKNNREIVNFALKNINEEMAEANLDYDHTDQRYALTNLKEIIKRNFRDKSKVWWREYKEIISWVIIIFVMTLSFIFIISKIGDLMDKAGSIIQHADTLINVIETKAGSGVVTQ